VNALFSFCRPVFYFPLGCACSVLYLVVFEVILLYFLTVTFVWRLSVCIYSRFFMLIRFVRSCMHVLLASTVCPPKKYPYNNRIISIEGTFLGDTQYIYCRGIF
jgi:hypothetical protein